MVWSLGGVVPMVSDSSTEQNPEFDTSVPHSARIWNYPELSSLVGRLARLGCTRMGSPSIFGKLGG